MTAKLIFVAATSDDSTSLRVVDHLQRKGQDVVVFAVDKVVDGSATFAAVIHNGEVQVTYADRTFSATAIASAWLWHPDVALEHPHYGHNSALRREMLKTLEGVWSGIDDTRWVNPPRCEQNTQNKAPQMIQAQCIGLQTPPTVLTNQWSYVTPLGDTTIIKMPLVGSIEDDIPKTMLTTVLDKQKRAALHAHSPFPGMHQPYIRKKREWRVTIVGDRVFSAAIYTKPHARDDWRRHSHRGDAAVIFKAEPLPDANTAVLCCRLMKKLGLRYGAFDFVETPEGEMVFLEVNSAGQHGWLEGELGLPISEAIADLLITITAT